MAMEELGKRNDNSSEEPEEGRNPCWILVSLIVVLEKGYFACFVHLVECGLFDEQAVFLGIW